MATLSERFRAELTGGPAHPIESMTIVVKTYGKGVSNAVEMVQAILGNEGAITDGMTITSVERIHE